MAAASVQSSVATVLGFVDASTLGPTLAHEHCLVDQTSYWVRPTDAGRKSVAEAPIEPSTFGISRYDPLLIRDNLLVSNLDLAVEELSLFRAAGGQTVVDLSVPDLGRNVAALQSISRRTGLNVITSCGHYVHTAHPASLADETVESIAARLVEELQVGIDGSEVRPGIIGEIGTSNPIHPSEEKVLRAAARAHVATGTGIVVHLAPPPVGGSWQAQHALSVLESEGADLGRVLLSHLDIALAPGVEFEKTIGFYRELARTGCFIGFDSCGKHYYFPAGDRPTWPPFWLASDRERALAVAELGESGHISQILLSHDVCFKIDLVRYGGVGYSHALRGLRSILRDYGIGDGEFHQLFVENPRRLLATSPRA